MAILERIKHLRITDAQNAAFTGLDGELVRITDTNRIAMHDGVTPGGRLIGGNVEFVASATGVNSLGAAVHNWVYAEEGLQPDGSGYLTLLPGMYSIIIGAPAGHPVYTPIVTVSGNRGSAFDSGDFLPGLVFNVSDGHLFVADVDPNQYELQDNKIRVMPFDAAEVVGSNTLLVRGSVSRFTANFLVTEETTARLEINDAEAAWTGNVNFGNARFIIYRMS